MATKRKEEGSGGGGGKSRGDGGNARKKAVERMMEVTGANEEDVRAVLAECDEDVNRATHLLLDHPFEEVCTKRGKKTHKKEEQTTSNGEDTNTNAKTTDTKRTVAGVGTHKHVHGNVAPRTNGQGTGKSTASAGYRNANKPARHPKIQANGARPMGTNEGSAAATAHKRGPVGKANAGGRNKANPRPPSASTTSGRSFTDILKGPKAPEGPTVPTQESAPVPQEEGYAQVSGATATHDRDEEIPSWGQQQPAEEVQTSWKDRVSSLGPIGDQQQDASSYTNKREPKGPVLPPGTLVQEVEQLPLQFGQISVNNSGLPQFGASYGSTFANQDTDEVNLPKANQYDHVPASSLSEYSLPTTLHDKATENQEASAPSSGHSAPTPAVGGDAGSGGHPPDFGQAPQYYGLQPGNYPFMVPHMQPTQPFVSPEVESRGSSGQGRQEGGTSLTEEGRKQQAAPAGAPMTTTAPPMPPMTGYNTPGVPPGMSAQFGPAMYPTYPYMAPPSAAYYMPNPYNPYGPPAGGYAHHGGAPGYPGAPTRGAKPSPHPGGVPAPPSAGSVGYGSGATKPYGSSSSSTNEDSQVAYTMSSQSDAGMSHVPVGAPGMVPGEYGVGGYFNMAQGGYQQGSYSATSAGAYAGQYQPYGQPMGMQHPQGGL
uniref:GBF-interacting protein 1 N-terminal domain-containing protein n=1 Tax=Picocystis salinarum TaxID=88271 RepID=A0A7S3UBI0_9CHLO|mmetsp:Transcript_48/g.423  ORF Transcript_48/g.423 Transcript_48/m.423 type:complete len:654 (+) Transcript_48:112-2073(+)|eukprot:CAMPEP_0183824562 /NCGR_PEP_ID=MMETSP0807_2-20130328/648_1 /TAXON_ID=88271 /ORGANISM="Picocystis salinarum, Strain CCMP1897" /LENGTH=653 /DNA_ID=CAMNT_0026069495 /DNA_START=27 /DNA_END=1988 /DNA_ORIENTATION=+